jgi:fructokinase
MVGEFLESEGAECLGIAAFGPIELRSSHSGWGTIGNTPKKAWQGINLVSSLGLGMPVAIDTDVGAAALGEMRWGAAKGELPVAYMTVGTGIGVGLVAEGAPYHGVGHPEAGHVIVRRIDGDVFEGNCPFHGDCLEGMASGPAIEARYGAAMEALDEKTVARATDLAARYVAQGVRDLVLLWSPAVIVVGGGVSRAIGFHDALRRHVVREVGGYVALPDDLIRAPGLEDRSGLLGAWALGSDLCG